MVMMEFAVRVVLAEELFLLRDGLTAEIGEDGRRRGHAPALNVQAAGSGMRRSRAA
jgi:hypothetical protein